MPDLPALLPRVCILQEPSPGIIQLCKPKARRHNSTAPHPPGRAQQCFGVCPAPWGIGLLTTPHQPPRQQADRVLSTREPDWPNLGKAVGSACQAQLGSEEGEIGCPLPAAVLPSPVESPLCLFQVPQQSPGEGPEDSIS